MSSRKRRTTASQVGHGNPTSITTKTPATSNITTSATNDSRIVTKGKGTKLRRVESDAQNASSSRQSQRQLRSQSQSESQRHRRPSGRRRKVNILVHHTTPFTASQDAITRYQKQAEMVMRGFGRGSSSLPNTPDDMDVDLGDVDVDGDGDSQMVDSMDAAQSSEVASNVVEEEHGSMYEESLPNGQVEPWYGLEDDDEYGVDDGYEDELDRILRDYETLNQGIIQGREDPKSVTNGNEGEKDGVLPPPHPTVPYEEGPTSILQQHIVSLSSLTPTSSRPRSPSPPREVVVFPGSSQYEAQLLQPLPKPSSQVEPFHSLSYMLPESGSWKVEQSWSIPDSMGGVVVDNGKIAEEGSEEGSAGCAVQVLSSPVLPPEGEGVRNGDERESQVQVPSSQPEDAEESLSAPNSQVEDGSKIPQIFPGDLSIDEYSVTPEVRQPATSHQQHRAVLNQEENEQKVDQESAVVLNSPALQILRENQHAFPNIPSSQLSLPEPDPSFTSSKSPVGLTSPPKKRATTPRKLTAPPVRLRRSPRFLTNPLPAPADDPPAPAVHYLPPSSPPTFPTTARTYTYSPLPPRQRSLSPLPPNVCFSSQQPHSHASTPTSPDRADKSLPHFKQLPFTRNQNTGITRRIHEDPSITTTTTATSISGGGGNEVVKQVRLLTELVPLPHEILAPPPEISSNPPLVTEFLGELEAKPHTWRPYYKPTIFPRNKTAQSAGLRGGGADGGSNPGEGSSMGRISPDTGIREMERGCWIISMHPHHGWTTESGKIEFWKHLKRNVEKGRCGAVCVFLGEEYDAESGDDADPEEDVKGKGKVVERPAIEEGEVEREMGRGKGRGRGRGGDTVKVYCWGGIVELMWAFLFVISDRKTKTGVRWVDAAGKTVIRC